MTREEDRLKIVIAVLVVFLLVVGVFIAFYMRTTSTLQPQILPVPTPIPSPTPVPAPVPKPPATPTPRPPARRDKIKGFYLWSWKAPHDPNTGEAMQTVLPPSYNLAISFTGWGTLPYPVTQYDENKQPKQMVPLTQLFAEIPQDKPLLICDPSVGNALNLLNVGGGSNCVEIEGKGKVCAPTGDWTKETLEPGRWQGIIAKTKNLGYNGFCFDLEEGRRTIANKDASDVLSPSYFTPIFRMCKDAGMYVMLSCSWFGVNKWGFDNVAVLRNSWISAVENGLADIFSPQLYDVSPCGTPWDGEKIGENEPGWNDKPELVTLKNRLVALGKKLVPSINDRGSIVGINRAFPNNGGYIMYCQDQKDNF